MPENKKSGVKKIFPAVVLVMSFYYSVLFAIGLLLGYLATVFYCKKFGINENSSEKKIFLNLGKWDIHIHHWIMGVMLIILIFLGGWKPEIPVFVWGLIIGMIIQDIYDFNDWHQVIIKNENHK